MTKKASAVLFAAIICIFAFSSCKNQEPQGENASIISNNEAVNIQEDYSFISEQLSVADTAKAVISSEDLTELINNPDAHAVSYDGTEDIIINYSDYIDKTVIIKTSGSFTLASSVNTLVAKEISGSFSVEAKADNIIIEGTSITADIKKDTGNIYIKGKDAVINISANTEKVFVHNATAVINNYSNSPVIVTLANGTQTEIAEQKSYNVYENLIYDIR